MKIKPSSLAFLKKGRPIIPNFIIQGLFKSNYKEGGNKQELPCENLPWISDFSQKLEFGCFLFPKSQIEISFSSISCSSIQIEIG